METQKLNDSSNEESKFATKKWYAIDNQTAKDKYSQNNSLKFETESVKSSLCDYSDTFILVTGDITVTRNNDTYVAFKNCAPFHTWKIEINDVFIDEASHIYIAMPMYSLIEYSDNYSDTSGNLWQFRNDEVQDSNVDLAVHNNNGIFNSQSFKYKAAPVGKTANAVNNSNSSVKNTKIIALLKYLSNFWRSIEIPLINCKIHLELNWIEGCILSSAGSTAKFNIRDAKLHVPIVN